MKLIENYHLQNIETDEYFLGFNGSCVMSNAFVQNAKILSLDDAKNLLKDHKEALEDYMIIKHISMSGSYYGTEPDPISRIRFEQDELLFRLKSLNPLLNNPQPEHINDTQWALLNVQASIMRSYVQVLSQRLDN